MLDALPRSVQPLAKKMLAEVRDAEDKDHAREAAKAFDAEFRAKWPKAAAKLRDDLDELLAFYDFPAEHWVHLKTSNPIELTFSTVAVAHQGHQGAGLAGCRAGDGLQADGGRRAPLAVGERAAPRRPGAGRGHLPEGGCWSRANCRTGRSPRDQAGWLIHNS